MSRDILSRGLTSDTKEWKVGYYANTHLNDGEPVSLAQARKHHLIIENGIMWYIVGASKGQFTGLIDLENTQIFDGDILKDDENFVWKVYFKHGAFYAECGDLMAIQLLSTVNFYCRVIGNIHEHSHLLEVKDENSI